MLFSYNSKKSFLLTIFILTIILDYSISALSEKCLTDGDCIELNVCNHLKEKCVHKRIFPITATELAGLITIIFGSALSNAGGIGGGGLLIPILLLMLKFYTHEAIPISKLMIFTGALTSFILGFRQPHPSRRSISIDYNIPMLLVPFVLFGTMVGVTLNKVTPPWIILVSLTLVLIINTYKTLKKGRSLYKQENKERNVQNDQIENPPNELFEEGSINKPHDQNQTGKYEKLEGSSSMYTDVKITTPEKDLLRREEIKDLRKCPLDKVCVMLLSYIFMLLISFLKGSDYMKSIIDIKICTAEYWFIYSLYLPFALIVTYIVATKIKKEYEYRKSIGYPYNSSDIKWEGSVFIKFPIYAFVSGLMAGLLGIGGGLILGPLLLELGLHPVVSTATSNFLVLFTSSSTSIQFILLGMMNKDFGIACTIASSFGSLVGTFLIQKLLSATKRNSYLIFALASVLGVSTLLIPAHTLLNMIDQIESGKSIWNFNYPC